MSDTSNNGGPRRARWWLRLAAVLPVLLGALWGVATPLGASPDEGHHLRYAWAVVTGQAFGDTQHPPEAPDRLVVTGVAPLAEAVSHECYAFRPERQALDCGGQPAGADGVGTTYMARYPVAYYAPVGAAVRGGLAVGVSPEVLPGGLRIISGAVSGLVVVVAGWVLVRRYRPLAVVASLTFALTPIAWFLSGSINPNGFEIAVAVLLAAVVLALRHDLATGRAPSTRLAVLLPVSAVLLANSRPVSAAWAGLLLAALLLPLRDPGGVRRTPVRRLPWWSLTATALGLVAGLAFFAWLTRARGDDLTSVDGSLWESLPLPAQFTLVQARFGDVAADAVGTFGWLDTPLPDVLVLGWLGALAVVAVRWLDGGSRPEAPRWLPPAIVVGGLSVVTAHTMVTAFGWQGRYYLPFLAGALVLAVAGVSAASERAGVRGTLAAAAALAWFVQCVSPLWAWSRHALGLESALLRFELAPVVTNEPAVWWPGNVLPVLAGTGLALFLAGLAVLGGLLATDRGTPRPGAGATAGPGAGGGATAGSAAGGGGATTQDPAGTAGAPRSAPVATGGGSP